MGSWQKLLTKNDQRRLPAIGTQEGRGEETVAYVKFFAPWSHWTWYAMEYDPGDRVFFGLVQGHEEELGYFGLDEMASIRGRGGLKIERDQWFRPTSLSKLATK